MSPVMTGIRIRVIFIFLLISSLASATNYYVSSSAGNDALDGKSTANAWKTLSKVSGKTFSAGDSVFFRRGDTWRESLTITTSGTSSSNMYYGAYGTGANPRFLGSETPASWSDQGNNVWKSSSTYTDPLSVGDYGAQIFFEKTDGTVGWGINSSSATKEFNWYSSSGYIYVYSGSNPATAYKSIEIPQRASIINLNDKNYLHIDGIDLFYCGTSAVTYKTYPMISLTGLIIENAEIGYVSVKDSEAGYGIDATYSNQTVRHCNIHDCGRRSISHHLYGNYTATNILIEDNYFHDGWHTTGPDFSVGGSGTTGSIDGVIIRRNKFYDPPTSTGYSEEIFIQNYLYSTLKSQVKNIYIYSNIFISPTGNSINMEGSQSVYIYNNVFYNHNNSGSSSHVWIDNNNSSVKVKNNIFYTTSTDDIGGTEFFIRSGQDISKVDANYNLYYRVANNLRIVDKEGTGSYFMGDIAKIRSQLGIEMNSPTPANPNFVSTTDYHVQAGSPALAAGVYLDVVATDYNGNAFTNPPNIGCFATPSGTAELAYVSSSIAAATPSQLDISFNANLATIVPAASAFTVVVNGTARSVSSVSVSGAKVLLTLSSAVSGGDVVTVAYTKPAVNPVQTPSGSVAPSFTAQPVTNNVAAAIPVYVSSVIQNVTPSVLEITFSLALTNIVPAASAFTVMVNSVARSVSSVTVSGTKVSLTLSSAVVAGNSVTVAYTKPLSQPLQTSAGGLVASMSAQPVTNNVNPTLPVFVSAVVQNATPSLLTMTYSSALANIVPSASAFTVTVNSNAVVISSVAVSGTLVQLTLANPVVFGNTVRVSYTKPASNPLQTSSGGQAESITNQAVTNNVAQVPVYVSSSVPNATPNILEISYTLSLANILPAASSFAVMVDGTARTVSSVSVSGTKVLLTLASAVAYGNAVTVAYTKPGTNPLQTSAGGVAASFTAQVVTNNVNPAVPAYVSSVVQNATPALITITYNQALANIIPAGSAFEVTINSSVVTVSSVAVSGSTVQLNLATEVAYGNAVKVSYTMPSVNQLQTAAGGKAESFSALTVTNNVAQVPAYVSSIVQNATPSILEITYSLSLANILPVTSAFDVKVAGVSRSVTSVAVSGAKVLLTLSSPVVFGNTITVAYTKPVSSPLQTSAGGVAASLSAQNVINGLSSPVPVYVSSVVQNATPAVIEMTYSLTLANTIPATTSFSVMVNGSGRSVTSVLVAGTKVFLTLSSAIVYGNTVTVAYTKPSLNPIQTPDGGVAVSITAKSVTNNVAANVPIFVSAAIANGSPSALVMTYTLALSGTAPAPAAFTVMVNSVKRSVSTVSISGTQVTLTLASPVIYGDAVTVAYTKPTVNYLQTSSGGIAATLTAQNVTNSVSAVIPVYQSSVVENATPSTLAMSYNTTLAGVAPAATAFTVMVNSVKRNVNSVVVSGFRVLLTLSSPVVYGDIVTVSYTVPAVNPIQTASGGKAVSIAARPVANNVNPLVPSFVSAVVENSSPSLLTMKYNLSLTTVVPASSAFVVKVNLAPVLISGVAISGGRVQLTLSEPVAFGDVVTVSYIPPSVNPLQTSSGAEAAGITDKPVTNNVGLSNTPPVISVSYEQSVYSGFISLLDASDSYDPNNDQITFEWTPPSGVPVSSTTTAAIRFLAPVVNTQTVVNFNLSVSDGKSTQTKTIAVTLLPYQPGLPSANITSVEADTYIGSDLPTNVTDGNIKTWWSSEGDGHWLVMKLFNPYFINYLHLSFPPTQVRAYYFDIYGSADNENWDPLVYGVASCSFSGNTQVFELPAEARLKAYSYIKILVHGNQVNDMNFVSELKAYGVPLLTEVKPVEVTIFPNPADSYFNLTLSDTPDSRVLIRTINMRGDIIIEKYTESAENLITLPLRMRSGTYIVQVIASKQIIAVGRLIVHESQHHY